MAFQIEPLSADAFQPLFALTDEELAARNIDVHIAPSNRGYPCRVSLRYAAEGERVLLLNHEHQSQETPYRASHAIFVRQNAQNERLAVSELPETMRSSMLSVRAFNAAHRIIDACLAQGSDLPGEIERLFANPDVAYLHFHYASRGCYAARALRA